MLLSTMRSGWRSLATFGLMLGILLQPLVAYAAFLSAAPVGEKACCRTGARCCCRKTPATGPTVSSNACGAGCGQLLPGHVRPLQAVARQSVPLSGFIDSDIEPGEIAVGAIQSQTSLERSQRPPPARFPIPSLSN